MAESSKCPRCLLRAQLGTCNCIRPAHAHCTWSLVPGGIACAVLTSCFFFFLFLRLPIYSVCFSPLMASGGSTSSSGTVPPVTTSSSVSTPGKNHLCHFTLETSPMPVGLIKRRSHRCVRLRSRRPITSRPAGLYSSRRFPQRRRASTHI